MRILHNGHVEQLSLATIHDMPKKKAVKKKENLVRVFWMIEPKQKKLIEQEAREQKYISSSDLIRDMINDKFNL